MLGLLTAERGFSSFAGALLATPTATANQLCPSMAKHPGCVAWQAIHPTGPLRPSFVEWMMGFPYEWTACTDSETQSSLSALK